MIISTTLVNNSSNITETNNLSNVCGVVECETLLHLTDCFAIFSLVYTGIRLGFICHYLLYQPEQEDPDNEVHIAHATKRHCLWEMAGMILMSYEVILSFLLLIGTGCFIFEVKGFLVLMWCLNYPVFLICYWVLGFFLTKCCLPHHRMTRSTVRNCAVVVINVTWRVLLYWCALNLLFHPDVNVTNENDLDLRFLQTLNEGIGFAVNVSAINVESRESSFLPSSEITAVPEQSME